MKTQINSRARFAVILLAVTVFAGSGCAPVILAGGASGAIVANDERTAGAFIEDQEIELKLAFQISEEIGRQVNVNVTSVNRRALLTGQVPTEKLHRHVLEIVNGVANIREVIDRLDIAGPSSVTARAADTTLTAKVKSALCGVQTPGFSCLDVKVVSESGVVYLMGLVTKSQAEIAVQRVRETSGVLKAVKVFEYIDEDA